MKWFEYLRRENTIHYLSLYNRAYFPLSRVLTGFHFEDILYDHDGKIVTVYLVKEQEEEMVGHFINLSQESKEVLRHWYKTALDCWKREEDIIRKFQTYSLEDIRKNHRAIYNELFELFLYLSVIPFYVLDTMTAYSGKVDDEVLQWFEHLRTRSRVKLHEMVLEKIWEAAAQKIGWKDKFDISFCTVSEVQQLFDGVRFPSHDEIRKRKEGCVFHYNASIAREVFYYDKCVLADFGIKERIVTQANIVNGRAAHPGMVQGRVSIVNRVGDMKKFKDGDIVVSINTNPSLLPVLGRCTAIVTDEGGLACHAAVLSRELAIPCVIGTKNATRVFQDGDMIEVDAGKGIARKIS